LGETPDELFNLSPPVGLSMIDMVHDIQYEVDAEGLDPFKIPPAAAKKRNVRLMVRLIIVLSGIVLIVFGVRGMMRKKTKSKE
jgi:hypothetical protein